MVGLFEYGPPLPFIGCAQVEFDLDFRKFGTQPQGDVGKVPCDRRHFFTHLRFGQTKGGDGVHHIELTCSPLHLFNLRHYLVIEHLFHFMGNAGQAEKRTALNLKAETRRRAHGIVEDIAALGNHGLLAIGGG